GAGRVLGLLSVAEVRRRLMLDLSDFFSKGFAFNRIDGDIRIAGGLARSDNLMIDGPAAEIQIRGDTDLRSERFDQTVDVKPK
ncbi:AsmA-like C-terminal region-containing protein, partial [Pseudomonas sp. BJa3]|uniref:YhdP family protein n=1 Tax=Pseudomonas sp. BJa3 TaxID=2986525 RepID=UPI002265D57A